MTSTFDAQLDAPAKEPDGMFLVWDPKDREVLGTATNRENAEATAGHHAFYRPGRSFYVLSAVSVTRNAGIITKSLGD